MEAIKKGDKMEPYSLLQPHKAVKCISCNLHFYVSKSTEEPYICGKCKSETFRTEMELAEENRQLKKILRDIWNINSCGNMEYFGESVMEILNAVDKSLWEGK